MYSPSGWRTEVQNQTNSMIPRSRKILQLINHAFEKEALLKIANIQKMQTRTAPDNQGVRSSQPGESVFRVPDFFLRSYMAEVFLHL